MRSGLLGRLEAPVAWLRAPDVLGTALLSVSEMPESAVGHGTLSALVHESLAAGALPVLNSRLGAVEVGLDLPTYTTSEELGDVISAHLADPEGTAARAAELREVVLDAHTWDHRAAQLDALVRERPRARGRRRRPARRCTTSRTTTGPTPTRACSSPASTPSTPTRWRSPT